MNSFNFNPTDGFLNTTSYPDPASGTAARTQMQSLHSQTRDYLNDVVVPTINSMQDSITALNTALTALSESITTQNLYIVVGDKTYKITVEEGAVVPVEEVSNG